MTSSSDAARRDHLGYVRFLVLPHGVNQFLDLSPVQELLVLGLENLRLARGRAETAVLVNHHCHRKDGQRGKAKYHGGSEKADVSQQLRKGHGFLLCAAAAGCAAFILVGAPLGRSVRDLIS